VDQGQVGEGNAPPLATRAGPCSFGNGRGKVIGRPAPGRFEHLRPDRFGPSLILYSGCEGRPPPCAQGEYPGPPGISGDCGNAIYDSPVNRREADFPCKPSARACNAPRS